MRKSISQLNMLSPEEHRHITCGLNDTAADYPKDKCVHTLFEEQVAKAPDKTAVIACDRELTYGELNQQANRIAHSLIEKGIQPGDLVAFMLPRKSYLLSAMFGILKSGAAYLPIDPDYPQDRIDYMLSDSGARLCITEESISELLANEDVGNPNVKMISDNPCYCIYTSGSTGKPKGTVLTHKNVNNYTQNQHNNVVRSIIKEGYQAILSITTVGFDIFVTESILPLLNKMTIVLANENQAKFQKEINALLIKHPCDIIQTTPTRIKTLIADEKELLYLQQLKVIILGGEALDEALVEQLYTLTDAEIFNIYGPTETTVWSTYTPVIVKKAKKNTKIYQLNILSPKERREVLTDFNNTAAEYPKEKCVHTLFEEQVENNPEKTAVIACDRELTYQELNEQANRIAHSLIEQGIRPGDIVAFMLPRKSYLLSAMFGILKSGAAYMPIDPDYPQDRIDYLLSDSDAKLCITEENISELLANQNMENPNVPMTSECNYCALHTFGSTGKPKLSLLRHCNLQNFIQGNKHFFENVQLCISATIITFDVFIMDTVMPLYFGIPIKLLSNEQIFNQILFEEAFLKTNNVIFFATPTKLKNYLSSSHEKWEKHVSVFVIGGEVFPKELYEQIRQTNKEARVFNIYGPTETTVWVSTNRILKPCRISVRKDLLTQITITSHEEREKLIKTFNNTIVEYCKEKCIHTLFEEQVTKTPDKTAVIACDRELTYRELNEQANRIAHSLIEKGIQPGDIVAFMLPRKSYLLSAMFGILKSGAAYMPIDPDYPQDRIDYMLSDSGAKLCITEKNIAELLTNKDIENPKVQMNSDFPCYCIYTSGSTGKPKGTLISHRNVSNFCTNSAENHFANRFFNKCMILASTNSIAFDIVLQEIHFPLLNSISVLLLSTAGYLNDWDIKQLYLHREIGFITTPVKINLLMQNGQFCTALKNMSEIMIGADVLTKDLVGKVNAFTDAEIINGYGPTETTCGVTYSQIKIMRQNTEESRQHNG